MTREPSTSPHHIAILLFDGVEELDAVGPWEVMAHWTGNHPDDGWAVSCMSQDGLPVTASKGLVLGAHHAIADAPPLQVLIYPGGDGTRRLLRDPKHLEWVRAQRATVPLMTSVCTGALVYAAAGLLRERPATTYWAAMDELRGLDPTVQVRPADRWVDDGDLITSAGVSAGIDMALHLVARLAGPERAWQVRRGIQYDPQPPSDKEDVMRNHHVATDDTKIGTSHVSFPVHDGDEPNADAIDQGLIRSVDNEVQAVADKVARCTQSSIEGGAA